MALHKHYMKEIAEKLGYLTMWLPGEAWQLGDVISFGKDIQHETSLSALDIPFSQRSSGESGTLSYTSDGAVRFTPQAHASVPGLAHGAAMLDFGRAHAIALALKGMTTHRITDTASVGDAVMKRYEAGKWPKHWHVITELVRVQETAILIASEGGTSITLHGGAQGVTDMLMRIAAGVDFAITSGSVASFTNSRSAVVPLFKTSCVKPRLLLPNMFEPGGMMRMETFSLPMPEWEDAFEEAAFDDLVFLDEAS